MAALLPEPRPQHPFRRLAFAWRQRLAAVSQPLGYGEGRGYGR
jgi:hypothetical protein